MCVKNQTEVATSSSDETTASTASSPNKPAADIRESSAENEVETFETETDHDDLTASGCETIICHMLTALIVVLNILIKFS